MASTRKILVIDDSRAIHAFMDMALNGSNYQLIHVYSGKEGLEVLKQSSDIGLVLLDWEMPEKNGPEVLLDIQSAKHTLPVMMVTSKNDPADIQKMIAWGVVEYVMKPFTPDILLEKIKQVLPE